MKQDSEEFFKIPASVLNMLFLDRYFEYCQLLRAENLTLVEIYDHIDNKLSEYNLPHRYTNYESFKNAYYKWIKTKIQRNG